MAGSATSHPLQTVGNGVYKLDVHHHQHHQQQQDGDSGRRRRLVQLSSGKGEFVNILGALNKAVTKSATVGPSTFGRRLGGSKRIFVITGTWVDNTAQVEVNVPLPQVWNLWNDREKFTRWMPWISSVKPIYQQKIHWRSVDGLPNRGTVRFYPRGPSSCGIQMTISYKVPDILAPFGSSLSPLVQSIIQRDLERFATFASENKVKV